MDEAKPEPPTGTSEAATEATGSPEDTGGEAAEGEEQEEMLMSEEEIDTFFRETIAKLTSTEERENIKANVS